MNIAALANSGAVINVKIRSRLCFSQDKRMFCEFERSACKECWEQSSELLIATAMNGYRVVEVATTMRDRPDGATGTKKGPNLLYGMRFARAVLGTWRRERKAARTRLRSENTQKS